MHDCGRLKTNWKRVICYFLGKNPPVKRNKIKWFWSNQRTSSECEFKLRFLVKNDFVRKLIGKHLKSLYQILERTLRGLAWLSEFGENGRQNHKSSILNSRTIFHIRRNEF